MALGYEEWLPGPGLEGVVTAYWRVAGDGRGVPAPCILPDGHVELVVNRGDPVALSGAAFTGPQPERTVVGLLSRAVRMEYSGLVDTFGVRFHPAWGASFLGQPATALADELVPLAEACAPLDAAIARLAKGGPGLETPEGRAALDGLLAARLRDASRPDDLVVAMIDELLRSEEALSVAAIARELGMSPRQAQRRFVAAVGIAPKRFVRILRFGRVWQLATMGPPRPWAELATLQGYADQAHLVREFKEFGVAPPTHLFTAEWYEATEISRLTGPAPGVRSVQDPEDG